MICKYNHILAPLAGFEIHADTVNRIQGDDGAALVDVEFGGRFGQFGDRQVSSHPPDDDGVGRRDEAGRVLGLVDEGSRSGDDFPLDEVLADLEALTGCDGKRIADGYVIGRRIAFNRNASICTHRKRKEKE